MAKTGGGVDETEDLTHLQQEIMSFVNTAEKLNVKDSTNATPHSAPTPIAQAAPSVSQSAPSVSQSAHSVSQSAHSVSQAASPFEESSEMISFVSQSDEVSSKNPSKAELLLEYQKSLLEEQSLLEKHKTVLSTIQMLDSSQSPLMQENLKKYVKMEKELNDKIFNIIN